MIKSFLFLKTEDLFRIYLIFEKTMFDPSCKVQTANTYSNQIKLNFLFFHVQALQPPMNLLPRSGSSLEP